jgi:hypothetical protein
MNAASGAPNNPPCDESADKFANASRTQSNRRALRALKATSISNSFVVPARSAHQNGLVLLPLHWRSAIVVVGGRPVDVGIRIIMHSIPPRGAGGTGNRNVRTPRTL